MLTSRGLVALLALGHGFGFSPAQRTLRPRDRASLRAEPESAPENFFVGAETIAVSGESLVQRDEQS